MLHACLNMKAIILGKYHFVLYFLVLAMQVCFSLNTFVLFYVLRYTRWIVFWVCTAILFLWWQPRMLMTVDENLKPLSVPVRVGQAVDVVGQAGRPKTITGFQTHSTPVLLAAGERAELATDKWDRVPSLLLLAFHLLIDKSTLTVKLLMQVYSSFTLSWRLYRLDREPRVQRRSLIANRAFKLWNKILYRNLGKVVVMEGGEVYVFCFPPSCSKHSSR